MKDKFAEQIEMMADRRSKVPSMVLIYPLDQHQLRSELIGQKWMLKLCCMFPGGEHTLGEGDEVREGETHPELGWYRLDDLGEYSSTILKWAKSHEKILKVISPRLSAALEWVHQGEFTKSLNEQVENISGLSLPESTLPAGAGKYLPISSAIITLAGLKESDYRVLEGQGLVFLEEVFRRNSPCGNLHPFINEADRMLWLCSQHWDEMRAKREAADAARREELLGKYLRHFEANVSKVRILGDPNLHELSEAFVELTVLKDRERPSSRTKDEYWERLHSKLRERRAHLSETFEDTGEQITTKGRTRPEELLKEGTRAVIAGAPGAGKSTLLKYLALKTLQGKERLPVFLELKSIGAADVAAAKGNLAALIFDKVLAEVVCETEADRAGLREEFYRKLQAGSVAIFLDGLDEVSGTGFFNKLRHTIKNFLGHADFRNNSLFISTRPYALLDQFGPEEAQEVEIAALGPEQIKSFIKHYYGEDPAVAQKLLRPELRELASVPALLGYLLVLLRSNQGRLPEDRLELYDEVVQKLASEWDKEKAVSREFITRATRRTDFLAHLAFARLFKLSGRSLSRRFIFTGREILREAEQYCKPKDIAEEAAVLADEVKATALLRQVGIDSYAFAHLSLQEYMAATTLADQDDRVQLFCRAYFDPLLSEMEVLPITLGLTEHQPEIHDALERLPDSLDHKKLRLRARSLGYGPAPDWLLTTLGDKLDELVSSDRGDIEHGFFVAVARAYGVATGTAGQAIARRLAKRLGRDEDDYVRSRAVRASGILGSEMSIDLLRQALKDADSGVRVEAASLLGMKDEKAAIEVLSEELKSDEDNDKDRVINALWNIGSEAAARVLEEAVKKQLTLRREAIEALSHIQGEAAIPTLVDYLNDTDDGVRGMVVRSLGEIGGEHVLDALIRAVEDDKSEIAEEALGFLGRIGGEKAVRYLTGYLENHSGKLIGAAAEALGRAGATEAIPRLFELLGKYKKERDSTDDVPNYLLGGWIDDYVRVKIAGALCQLGDERGRIALIEVLNESYCYGKKYAAKALSLCHPEEARTLLPDVIDKTQDEYEFVPIAEILCDLIDFGSGVEPPVVAKMLEVLNSSRGSHNSLTSGAMNVLSHQGGTLAVEALTKETDHSDPMRQLAAMVSLGNIADESAVAGLLGGLIGEWPIVSQYAARGISRIESPALYAGLKLNASNKYDKVRLKIARCIFYYSHDEQAVELITELAAKDRHRKIKEAAQLALDQLSYKLTLYN